MTSDEKLVAVVAKELLEANDSIETRVQLATETDSEALKLPAIVVSAKLEDDEPDSPLPKRYALEVELRAIQRPDDSEALDEIFREVRETLCPDTSGTFSAPPPTMLGKFAWYRIENVTDSGHSRSGDTAIRSRTFSVFAKLL